MIREAYDSPVCRGANTSNLVLRAFSLRKWKAREKALASAGHMTQKNPEIVGVIN